MDWYLWRPCTGINGICPPLAAWHQMIDGTYELVDVKQMHSVMDEMIHQHKKAQPNV